MKTKSVIPAANLRKLSNKLEKKEFPALFMTFCLLGSLIFSLFVKTRSGESETFRPVPDNIVVVDAGHGGEDPGKVSSSGILEKDVNLAIALKCKTILEQNGITVILTRDSDIGISEPGEQNKKISDLKNRKQIIIKSHPKCAVSIHQNSYPDPSQKGSQVFYHETDTESKKLAEYIQKQIQHITWEENRREIKPDSNYYLLKNNPVPTVIAEVCFLSNPSEADMIREESVQEKAAFAIAMGIMQYLSS